MTAGDLLFEGTALSAVRRLDWNRARRLPQGAGVLSWGTAEWRGIRNKKA